MERKWLSNYKFYPILTIMLLIFLWNACTKNTDSKIDDNKYFTFLNEYQISKYSLLSGAISFVPGKNEEFYFSNLFARRIYKTFPPFTKIIPVGRRGRGPGEYLVPSRLYVYKNNLFFSDIKNGLIKSFGLNQDETNISNNSIYEISLSTGGGNKFVVDKKNVYVLDKGQHLLSIYAKKSGNLLYNVLEKNPIYGIPNRILNGGGIVIDSQGYLYTSSAAPYRIYKFITLADTLKLISQWDLSALPGVISWDEQKNQKYQNIKEHEKKHELLESITYVQNLFLIEDKVPYLIVHLCSKENENLYHLLNIDGELISSFFSTRHFLMGTRKNRLFFYDQKGLAECDSCTVIKEYLFTNER